MSITFIRNEKNAAAENAALKRQAAADAAWRMAEKAGLALVYALGILMVALQLRSILG